MAGDMNARTGIEPDFIPDEDNSFIPVPPFGSFMNLILWLLRLDII